MSNEESQNNGANVLDLTVASNEVLEESVSLNDVVATFQVAAYSGAYQITYVITGGSDENYFAINSSTGEVTLTQFGIDAVNSDFGVDLQQLTLGVTAGDGFQFSSQVTANINIVRVNDNQPDFTVIVGEPIIEQSVSEGDIVAIFRAADLDDQDSLTFFITSGNEYGYFDINSKTGTVKLTQTGVEAINADLGLDLGLGSNQLTLRVAVSDGFYVSNESELTLDLERINDNAPVINFSRGLSVTEESVSVDELVALFSASDLDDQDNVTYEITSGNESNYFNIDADTGEVVLTQFGVDAINNDSGLDLTELTLGVTVTDGVYLSAESTANISIKRVDDNPSEIIGQDQGNVIEDSVAQVSGALKVSDIDDGDDPIFKEKTIVGSYGKFTIDADGNWLFDLDNEAVQHLREGQIKTEAFTVTALTTQGVALNDSVYVEIKGVNDTAVISGVNTGEITEDVLAPGRDDLAVMGKLNSLDLDQDEAGFIPQYAVLGDNKLGFFNMTEEGSWYFLTRNESPVVQGLKAGETLIDTLTVSSKDGSATQTLTVTIHGADDKAEISGASTGAVTEGDIIPDVGFAAATGKLTVTDWDNGEAGFEPVWAQPGHLGLFFINEQGDWSYLLDENLARPLGEGQTALEQFTVYSKDGVAQIITITVNGSNDKAVISGTSVGEVTEDVLAPGRDDLAVMGKLDIVDPDLHESGFMEQTAVVGDNGLGFFNVAENGSWYFVARNENKAIQGLKNGESLTDTLTVSSRDGSATQTLIVTIHGAEDKAEISGASTGAVTEDVLAPGRDDLAVMGKLNIVDPDQHESGFIEQTAVVGDNGLGFFNVAENGSWYFVARNENKAIQGLKNGESLTDTLTVSSRDGSATQTLIVTIHGAEDKAEISGVSTGAVTEDVLAPGRDDLAVIGKLNIVDPDQHESGFVAQTAVVGDNKLGFFNITEDGSWYFVARNENEAIQALKTGESLTDTLTVTSKDGSVAQNLTVTIHGADDKAYIVGTSTGTVTEGDVDPEYGHATVSDTLYIDDLDSGEASFMPISAQLGEFGFFSINEQGDWSYHLDENLAQSLAEGDIAFEEFTVTSKDGSATETVSITVNGVNDPAQILYNDDSAISGVVYEDGLSTGKVESYSGQLTISDPDVGESYFHSYTEATEYGFFSIDRDGRWEYRLNNESDSVQALASYHDTVSDIFTVESLDGSVTQDIRVWIQGADDESIIHGQTRGVLMKNVLDPDVGALVARGNVTIEDKDHKEWGFYEGAGQKANYGYYAVSEDGGWIYMTLNEHPAIQALGSDEVLTDIFLLGYRDLGREVLVKVDIYGGLDAYFDIW